MKRLGLITLVVLAFAGCSKEAAKGELFFGVSCPEVSLDVDETKAAVSEEVLKGFTISIPGSDFVSDTYANLLGKYVAIAIGDYTAEASSCTEEVSETGYGCVRYTGASDKFTVTQGGKTDVTIPCSISNSKVSVMLSPKFIQYFNQEATTVTISTSKDGTSRPLKFTYFHVMADSDGYAVAMTNNNHLASQYAFYLPDRTLYVSVTTSRKGSASSELTTFSIPTTVSTDAKSWHRLKVDVDENSTSGGIEFKIDQNTTSITNKFSIDGYTDGTVTEDR